VLQQQALVTVFTFQCSALAPEALGQIVFLLGDTAGILAAYALVYLALEESGGIDKWEKFLDLGLSVIFLASKSALS